MKLQIYYAMISANINRKNTDYYNCRVYRSVSAEQGGHRNGETGMHDKLTPNDMKKIEAEIAQRKNEVRPKLLEAVKEARALGDLSENFEYYAAKREKNRNESRIRYLENMLRTATLLEDDSEEDEVGVNNTVELYMENRQQLRLFKIVTTVRADAFKNMISIESPIGKAVLGHKAGERVYVKVNDDYGYYVTIRSVDSSTDDEDDEINKF